jgi:thiosulfate dehydrogenase (quinone) large subunit
VLEPLEAGRPTRVLVAGVRVVVAMMWIQNLNWKIPPDFGRARKADLFAFVQDAVTHPVVPAYSWLVEHLILPNLTLFGYLTLLTEFGLGVFLLTGLLTRFWALVGIAQSLAIALSVLNTPGEWHWAYFLMIAAHVLLFATAAGRVAGLDGVLRPLWRRLARPSAPTARTVWTARLARLAVIAS